MENDMDDWPGEEMHGEAEAAAAEYAAQEATAAQAAAAQAAAAAAGGAPAPADTAALMAAMARRIEELEANRATNANKCQAS